jgi:PIF1-like helicase/Helix-turn-helix domain/Helicase
MSVADSSNYIFQMAAQFVNQTNRHIFLTGNAGTGKTTFLKYIQENGFKKTVVVAPTGVAAINAGGVTMHSFFQLPFGPYLPSRSGGWNGSSTSEQALLKNIRFSSSKRELLRELELLIIDEISMVRADMLDAVDAILRHFRHEPLVPFGGVQVLYIGDLFQLPPVVNREEWENALSQHYKSPFFFDSMVIHEQPPLLIELKKIYRQNETEFINILNHIRDNQTTKDDLIKLHEHFKPGFNVKDDEHYIILTTHNKKANEINEEKLRKLPGRALEFKGELTGDFNEKALPAEMFLQLKIGAQIMFIKNDKGEFRRYYNGKIATISKMDHDKIFVRFPNEKNEMGIEKEVWKNIRYNYSADKGVIEEETLGTFTQYPIRLAWAITIHKSQGLTFDKAIIDAGESFAPGQVYVALSRLTSLNGLILHSRIEPQSISTDQRVVAFSKSDITEEVLHQQLKEQQKVFIGKSLVQSFDLEKIVENFRQHYDGYDERSIPAKDAAITWAGNLLTLIGVQQEIARKFINQLERLLAAEQQNGYHLVYERVTKADEHFSKTLNEINAQLRQHIQDVKIKQRVKKYVAELNALELILGRKIKQVNQTAAIAEALMKGLDTTSLLALVGKQKNSPSADPQEPQKEGITQKKGETRIISLQMYKQGTGIADIASQRGMTFGTIENHLASFVASGEIVVTDIVPEKKIEKISGIIDASPASTPSFIRSKLGSDYSYAQIKAVMSHKQIQGKRIG